MQLDVIQPDLFGNGLPPCGALAPDPTDEPCTYPDDGHEVHSWPVVNGYAASGNYPEQLYDGHPPAQGHSATSVAASRSVEPVSGTARARVLGALRANPNGLADEQLQDLLDMASSTERPRRVELVELKLARDSGRTIVARSGRQAVVWIATE